MGLHVYKKRHLRDVARIYVGAFTAPPISYNFVNHANSEGYLHDITKKPGFLGYVYLHDTEIISFVFGSIDNYFEGSIFTIEEFAVDARFHRGGFGSIVIGLLERELESMGMDAITLNTSRRLPAYRFYLKHSFEEVADNVSLMKQLKKKV